MTHAMRKTIGPFSAGTRVDVRGKNSDGTVTVEVQVPDPKPGEFHSYDYEDMTMDLNADDIVELRNRTDSVPSTSRQVRRSFLKSLFGSSKEA